MLVVAWPAILGLSAVAGSRLDTAVRAALFSLLLLPLCVLPTLVRYAKRRVGRADDISSGRQ